MSYLGILLNGYNQVDDNGSELPQRSILNFTGAVVISDNPSTGATDIEIVTGGTSAITDLTADVIAFGPGVASATVQAIRGRTVASTLPSDGALLVYDSPTSTWNPRAASGDVTLDAAGSFTVVGIQTYPVSTTAPISGDVMAWNTLGYWEPSSAAGGGISQLTGDITAGPGTGSQVAAIAAGVIVDNDVNASAAIAGTKIAPDFGSQTVQTTGQLTVGAGGSGSVGKFGGGGTDGFAQIGTRVGGPAAAALYMLGNGGVPAAGNYVLLCSGAALEVNAPSTGLYLEVGQTAYLELLSSLVTAKFAVKLTNVSAPSTPSGGADLYATSGHVYSLNSDGDTYQLS